MLKIAQAALIGLHGVQFWCPHARSRLRKPVCAGKSAVKFVRVDGPLEFPSYRSQRVHLDDKVSALVNVVSEVPQSSILEPLLFILCTSELFHIVRNHIVGYANDTKIYVVTPNPLLRLLRDGIAESGISNNQLLGLQWHMKFNPKKTKSMVVSQLC